MKSRLMALMLVLVSLVVLTACGPGSSVEVSTPNSTVRLSAPGPNPLTNQPDSSGRVARAVAGFWHGIVAPATLVISFFDSDVRMYEVHNAGSEYDLGFVFGLAITLALLGLFMRMRR